MATREVIVLQHSECENPGTLLDALRAAQYSVRYVRLFAEEAVPYETDDAAGLIVMGGPMGVYEEDLYPFLRQELRLIESCLSDKLPVLGICLGSQLLATALGSKVVKGKRKEIGWHSLRLNDACANDSLFSGVPREFTAFHWHGDVFNLPADAVALASSTLTPCQGFRYGDLTYGLLCHLEVTPEIVEGMMKAFPEEMAEAGVSADEIRAGVSVSLPPLRAIAATVFSRWVRSLSIQK